MSTPVVFLAAPGAVSSSVRDVLRDWVVLGLVQPFLWIDSEDVPPGAALSDVVATHVRGALSPRIRLQDHLADQRGTDAVRLVLVASLGDRPSLVDTRVAAAVAQPLQASLPVISLQCVLTVQGAGGWDPDVPIPGWQTLVIAPEDRWNPSPRQPPTEFTAGGDTSERTAHSAATLAAVTGLWTGIEHGAFDTATSLSDPVAVRAFLRRLDASQVTAAVQGALMDVSQGLPRPETGQGRCEHLDDPIAAGAQVLQAVTTKHAGLFDMTLQQTQDYVPQKLGSWAAIKMFFAFLGSALKAAPGAFVNRVLDAGATAVSRQVQRALFGGTDSQYEVITRGRNAQGLPAGASELSVGSADVRRRLVGIASLPAEQPTPDVSGLWATVVYGGLTLADGGERMPGLGPVLIGGKPGVVRETDLIAPPPRAALPLPQTVAQRVGVTAISPYDVMLHEGISATMASAPTNDPEVVRTGEQFGTWRQRVLSSYTGQLGTRLAQDIATRRELLAQLLAVLQAAPDEIDPSAVAEALGKVRRVLFRFIIGLVLIAAICWGLARYTELTTAVLIAITTALFIAWLVLHVFAALGHYRRAFAILKSRERGDAELETAARNLPIAASGLARATGLYEQYLQWAPVLGRFLDEPFGPAEPPAVPVRLEGSLPRAVGFGLVVPDSEQVAVVAHEVGSTVFRPGWLTPLWESLFDDAAHRIGPAAINLRGTPEALWSDNARADDSLLRQWSTIVSRDGVESGAGDALWAEARKALFARGTADLMGRLMTTVDVQAQHDRITGALSGAEFFTALTETLADVEQHYFSPSLFTRQGQTSGQHQVARTVAIGRSDVAALDNTASSSTMSWIAPAEEDRGLDQFLVVVQSTAPAPASMFTLRDAHAPEVDAQLTPDGGGHAAVPDETALGG